MGLVLGSSDVHYVKTNEEVFNAWCNYVNDYMRGKFIQSHDVDPIGKNRIDYDCIYTPAEKKRLRPSKDCMAMYARSNEDAQKVVRMLQDNYGRELVHVSVTAYSLLDAILFQISHDRNKYKAEQFLNQIAYHMAKFPTRYYDIVEPFLDGMSYESYIKNVFHGTKFMDEEVMVAVITRMWNLAIDIVYPSDGIVPFYHNTTTADVVIVCNESKWPERYFAATKPSNERWKPIKGADWSSQIQVFTNVQNAHKVAEKKLRERMVKAVVEDYNSVSDTIQEMKEELETYKSEMSGIAQKINTCTANINKMESRQERMRQQLLKLNVDSSKLTKTGPILKGVHFTTGAIATASSSAVDPTDQLQITSTNTSTTSTPTVQSTPATPAPPSILGTPAVPVVPALPANTTGLPISTSAVVLTTSATATTPTPQIAQLITSGGTAVGGPQQIVNIAGQNVLISGSGPGTMGNVSVRYGRILKGVHRFFCPKCGKPFTGKADLKRHEGTNCEYVPEAEKIKFTCDTCKKNFSSKQYLREHVHQYHLQKYLYFCKGCDKGFYKHCQASHHKRSCLPALLGRPSDSGSSTTATPSATHPNPNPNQQSANDDPQEEQEQEQTSRLPDLTEIPLPPGPLPPAATPVQETITTKNPLLGGGGGGVSFDLNNLNDIEDDDLPPGPMFNFSKPINRK